MKKIIITSPVQSIFSFFFSISFVFMTTSMAQNTSTVSVNVGVVMDMDAWTGIMGVNCISMALEDFYSSHAYFKTRVSLHARDSMRDVVAAAAAALDLVKNVEVQAIIGPTSSMQANFMIELGEKALVPIISFTATSPSLSSLRSPYFIRATYNDSAQVKAISSLVQSFGWREAVPIYVDNDFGEGIVPFLTDELQDIDVRVPYRSIISPSATDDQIVSELYKLMTMQTRVFIVHMLPSLAWRLFAKAKEIGMMSEGYSWIITTSIAQTLGYNMNLDSMQGVLGIRPYVPPTQRLQNFTSRWKMKNFQRENQDLNIFGLWAYDSATSLAIAVEKSGTNFGFQKRNASANSSTDLEFFRVSLNGPNLVQSLQNIELAGLSGNYRIVQGQLYASVYEIINVIGNGGRKIGYWTVEKGLVREINGENLTSNDRLGGIIWPGDTTTPPKGWEVPTAGKTLRIGVPVKFGFEEFVEARINSDNTTTVRGFCIEVFDSVMATLPFSVSYEYIPFSNPDGLRAGTYYNDLVYQVVSGNYDAVVGDVTIIANRSQYVDYTLPYTESGVSLVVPVRDSKRNNAWTFLKPLTWDLWLTSFFSLVFTGFVIWALEHRINEDFRGPPSHQAGTILWFSFSTMVFAHREKIVSNLARFVVIIWVFVVLVLTQSYTASLTSMLTVQQLQPTVTDINQLLKSGENVGYLNGSFVYGLLKKMNFDDSRIKIYNSVDELHQLFSKGSANGGIAAALDEIPYLKLFLARHCSKYTMVGETYKTAGFGFVFPRRSPLVPDVSRAILNVTEGDKMVEIERAWFGQQTTCPDSIATVSSNSLSLDSFWGLFLIAGASSFTALLAFAAMFLYEHRELLTTDYPMRRKIELLTRRYDNRDLSSHTFKKSCEAASPRSVYMSSPSAFTFQGSPRTTDPPSSPSSVSCHAEGGTIGFRGGERGIIVTASSQERQDQIVQEKQAEEMVQSIDEPASR